MFDDKTQEIALETRYNTLIQVQRATLDRLNEGVAVHSVWREDEVLTGGVWDAFLALPPLLDRPLRSVAILGNAGGTTARAACTAASASAAPPRAMCASTVPSIGEMLSKVSGDETRCPPIACRVSTVSPASST